VHISTSAYVHQNEGGLVAHLIFKEQKQNCLRWWMSSGKTKKYELKKKQKKTPQTENKNNTCRLMLIHYQNCFP
jgi:hypothetical protein